MARPYYTLPLIKKNLEILPSDDSLDGTLQLFGAEGDAWVDAYLGNGSALSTVPDIVREAAAKYGAGAYKDARLKDKDGGMALMIRAEEQLKVYMKSLGRVTVFG